MLRPRGEGGVAGGRDDGHDGTTRYLQLATYGSSDRQIPAKVGQTQQLDPPNGCAADETVAHVDFADLLGLGSREENTPFPATG